MKIIDVHVHAGSSSGSTRLTLGLDILHIGIILLKVFPFHDIAVNGYYIMSIYWHLSPYKTLISVQFKGFISS